MTTSKRIGCRSCPRKLYNHSLGRCVLGKVNPSTRANTLGVMRMMGPSYVCSYNKWHTVCVDELLQQLRDKQGKSIVEEMS